MQEQAQLNVSDLQMILNIIDVATQRGTFKGGELSTIGQLYDRVDSFVKQHNEAAQAAQSADDAGVTGDTE